MRAFDSKLLAPPQNHFSISGDKYQRNTLVREQKQQLILYEQKVVESRLLPAELKTEANTKFVTCRALL